MKGTMLFSLTAVVLAGLLAGCGPKPPRVEAPGSGDVPDWYLNPEKVLLEKYGTEETYFYGKGHATKEVSSLAESAAEARAIARLTRRISLEVKTSLNDYLAQAGASGDDPGILEFTEEVTKQMAMAKLTGSRIIKWGVSKDGHTYYALAAYSLNRARELAAEVISKTHADYMDNQKALFNEFKARQAFEKLDADAVKNRMDTKE